MASTKSILLLASAVGPIGAPETGGVTKFLRNSTVALACAGYTVHVVAPQGNHPDSINTIFLSGNCQPSASSLLPTTDFIVPPDSILAQQIRWAWSHQEAYEHIINLNHDWLPYFSSLFFSKPLLHIANLTWSSRATDNEIAQTALRFPRSVAALSAFQAERLRIARPVFVPFGLEPRAYVLGAGTGGYLAWAGRIVPEKGLLQAAAIAEAANLPLRVAGYIGDHAYWKTACDCFGRTIEYDGFLDANRLQAMLGNAIALLQTQEWEEAFGVITVESMMCGTPVIGLRRGANAELISDRVNGFLIDPNDLPGAVRAVRRLDSLSRLACRQWAEQNYGLHRLKSAYVDWFAELAAQND